MSGLEVITKQLENKMKNCFQTVNGDDNLNKQDLIDKGYKHVCTQNSESKIELWAKFNGYRDTIVYLYYIPKMDMVLEQTRQVISYTQLDMMAQMRDKMRIDFVKLNIEYLDVFQPKQFSTVELKFVSGYNHSIN